MFGQHVYERGALVLHALRAEVGDTTFFEILHTYLERFGGATASTADFVELANEIADRDLDDLFDKWLGTGQFPDIGGSQPSTSQPPV
jgi:aminopeptidase N